MLNGNITTKIFLATANGRRDFEQEREQFLDGYGDNQESRESFATISETLPRTLARHVEAWISSGRKIRSLWEVPRARKLDFAAKNGIEGWLDSQQSSMIVVSDSGALRFDHSAFRHEGSVIAEPEEYAAREAVRMFLWLLGEGTLRYAIAHCENEECGQFYFRSKPREFYKRATFCISCRHKASSRRRMKEIRDTKQESAIASAIRARQRWLHLSPQSRIKFSDEDRYIISRIGETYGFGRNWLTRHRERIFLDGPPKSRKEADVKG